MKYLKSWVFKQFLLLMMILALAVFPVHAQETPNFDSLKAAFEQGEIFTADFSHRYEDSFTGETEENEGRIWIGREQYKIKGSNQVMMVDGVYSRVYDGGKNRVIISEYVEEEDDFAPSRMLQGVDDSYRVEESGGESGNTIIRLTSDDPFAIFEEVTIQLDKDNIPLEIKAMDQAENLLITRFENGQFIEEFEDLFDLEYPDDAEIIDLRYNSQ